MSLLRVAKQFITAVDVFLINDIVFVFLFHLESSASFNEKESMMLIL